MLFRETTKDTLDLVVSLIPHIEKIMTHDEVLKLFTEKYDGDKLDPNFQLDGYKFVVKRTLTLMPIFLDELREDVFMILAKINDTCIVDIENQSPFTTVKQIKELLMDKELMGFVQELR